LALLAAVNFNIVLFLLLLVLIFRNIIKLYVERRRRRAGSKLKTRLLLTFIGLAVLPSVALFLAASKLMTSSLIGWFDPGLERMAEGVTNLVSAANESQLQYVLSAARIARNRIAPHVRTGQAPAAELAEKLDTICQEMAVDKILFFDRTGQLLLSSQGVSANLPAETITPRIVGSAIADGVERADLDLTAAPSSLIAVVPVIEGGSTVGSIFVRKYLTAHYGDDLHEISGALSVLDDRQDTLSNARTWYVTILMLITLTIIFSATWLGMYLARELAGPIDRLVEGTQSIALGQYNIHINELGYDEIGDLIKSFNNMTRDLAKNRDNLELIHNALRGKNRELEQRTTELETVLRNIATGVIALSPDGVVRTINDSACGLLDVQYAAVVGKPIAEMLQQPDLQSLRNVIDRGLADTAGDVTQSTELFRENGVIHLSIRITRIANRDELQETYALVIFEDLTDVMRSQRMAAWQEVARRIAHEIKNPLTPIQLNAERIARKLHDHVIPREIKDTIYRLTQTIVESVDSMKGLVNEFSQFARMPDVALRPSSLRTVLEQAIHVYTGMSEDISITLSLLDELPPMNIDPDQLRRAFINLLDNAIHAMHGHGRIRISSELCAELQTVRVHFDDDGPGVPVRERSRIFLPYYSTKPGGSGLGLAIVQRIVADHGGYVRVLNNSEGGARFTIELPVPDVHINRLGP